MTTKPAPVPTRFDPQRKTVFRGILATAITLPCLHAAHADTAPERGLIAFKYLDYKDRQPGLDRISVRAPSLLVMAPVGEQWAIEGTLTSDTVSGASPSYHSEKTSATKMRDEREARDLRVTRFFPQGSLTLGASYSTESDYVSHVYSVNGSLSDETKNTTLHAGIAISRDRINPSNEVVSNEQKSITDLMLGVTQVLSPHDIAQINLTHGEGRGYYSDPYKFFDNRPRKKRQTAFQVRWNHYFDASGGTSQLAYRYYVDSFKVKAHTVSAGYVQPLADGWTITPMVRIHSQSAASFYLDPVNPPAPSIPDNFEPGVTLLSEDQRLSAFGARSIGMKLAKQLHRDWLIDVKYEHYRQKSEWCFNAGGSPGIAPLTAKILQLGITYFF
jgi:hypothetical protein